MEHARHPGIQVDALRQLAAREREAFLAAHPMSARLARSAADHWLNGVPMHWMGDWSTPHPLFVRSAQGAQIIDADGRHYVDFCLGDTGAMFGHSPAPIVRALAEAGAQGLTHMLPAERVARVGEKLSQLFGLPFWWNPVHNLVALATGVVVVLVLLVWGLAESLGQDAAASGPFVVRVRASSRPPASPPPAPWRASRLLPRIPW